MHCYYLNFVFRWQSFRYINTVAVLGISTQHAFTKLSPSLDFLCIRRTFLIITLCLLRSTGKPFYAFCHSFNWTRVRDYSLAHSIYYNKYLICSVHNLIVYDTFDIYRYSRSLIGLTSLAFVYMRWCIPRFNKVD